MEENFQIVDRYGNVIHEGMFDVAYLKYLRSGKLFIRQKPGPRNALGLIKFVFPNNHDVYLHGTPATALFSKARRDFSHGCIRIEDPVALAAWVLRGKPAWTTDAIQAAMDGNKTIRVTVDPPIPVLILYTTAVVTENGEVRFFGDIYRQDAALEQAFAHKYAYPD